MDFDFQLNGIRFVWDRAKADANLRKHGVAFESACDAFFDPFVCVTKTEIIDGEERETMVGMTSDWRLLKIVYVFRSETIRIISARPVTSQERVDYEEQ